mmetsp:Transcript_32762/g.85004  ORF Transcript_32762/g.85004 Transcript_32762/m.85004 type:complete len:207 (-) Transcript_32762:159-779(-)
MDDGPHGAQGHQDQVVPGHYAGRDTLLYRPAWQHPQRQDVAEPGGTPHQLRKLRPHDLRLRPRGAYVKGGHRGLRQPLRAPDPAGHPGGLGVPRPRRPRPPRRHRGGRQPRRGDAAARSPLPPLPRCGGLARTPRRPLAARTRGERRPRCGDRTLTALARGQRPPRCCGLARALQGPPAASPGARRLVDIRGGRHRSRRGSWLAAR